MYRTYVHMQRQHPLRSDPTLLSQSKFQIPEYCVKEIGEGNFYKWLVAKSTVQDVLWYDYWQGGGRQG